MNKIRKNWIEILLGIYVVMFGIFFIFFIPPFQKNDETPHFNRTIALVEGKLSCIEGYLHISKSFYDFISTFEFTEVLKGKNFDLRLFDFSRVIDKTSEEVKVGGLCGLTPIGYIPNAVGVVVAKWLTDSSLGLFYSGRVSGFLFFLVILFSCLKIIKAEYRKFVWGMAITPMVLSSVTGYSYDGVILSLIVMVLTIFINEIFDKKTPNGMVYLGYLAIVIISVIKIVYLPILLIYSALFFKKAKYKTIGLFILSLVLTIVLIKLFNRSNVETNYSLFGNPKLQSRLILADPLNYLLVWWNSWSDNWLYYYRSMVALVGWSSTPFAFQSAYLGYLVGIIWLIWSMPKIIISKMSLKFSVMMLAVCAGIVVAVMTAMYLMASVVAADRLVGAQGRYYLPILPFVILALARIRYSMNRRWIKLVGLGMFLIFLFISMVVGVYKKFYDPGKLGDTYLKPIDKQVKVVETINKDWILVDNDYQFFVASNTDQYIVGFEAGLGSRDKAVNIPYKVEIRDGMCKQILRSLYLEQFGIQGEVDYKEIIRPFKAKEDRLCVVVKPMTLGIPYSDSFMSLQKIGDSIKWQWIYEDKEAYLKQ